MCLEISILLIACFPQTPHSHTFETGSLMEFFKRKPSRSSWECWTLSPINHRCLFHLDKKLAAKSSVYTFHITRGSWIFSCTVNSCVLSVLLVLNDWLQTPQIKGGSITWLDSMCLEMSILLIACFPHIPHRHRLETGSLMRVVTKKLSNSSCESCIRSPEWTLVFNPTNCVLQQNLVFKRPLWLCVHVSHVS